jgi:hypothetical protein
MNPNRSMTIALKFSLLANLVLAIMAIYFAARFWTIAPRPREAPAVVSLLTDSAPPTRSSAFQWSSLESTDYRTYVSNLRSIGCPEKTIRDIITADVHSLYASREEQLEQQQAALEHSELKQLRSEEASLVSLLLGAASNSPESGRLSLARTVRDRGPGRIVSMPLAFEGVDPADMKLDDRQIAVIDELREKFEQDIGGPGQDPRDPAYRRCWQEAQRENDDLLAGLLGGQFFLDYQLQATNLPPSRE